MASADDIRELHEEARALRRERIRAMTPGERMDEAFRLFLLAREPAPQEESA